MNEITDFKKQTMTIEQIANAFNCDVRTIQLKVKELFPNLIKHGVKTLLNEAQVAILTLKCESEFALPQTDLTMQVKEFQVAVWKTEKLIAENAKLKEELEKTKDEKTQLFLEYNKQERKYKDADFALKVMDLFMIDDYRIDKMLWFLAHGYKTVNFDDDAFLFKNYFEQTHALIDNKDIKTITVNEATYKKLKAESKEKHLPKFAIIKQILEKHYNTENEA